MNIVWLYDCVLENLVEKIENHKIELN
jgi:hypothetical protein